MIEVIKGGGVSDLVVEFVIGNFGGYPILNRQADLYMPPLAKCVTRLPENVLGELIEKTVIYIPYDLPLIMYTHEIPESIVILPQSMRRWNFDTRVGAIASVLAGVLTGGDYCRATTDLAKSWGFEKEVAAGHEQMEAIYLNLFGNGKPVDIALLDRLGLAKK